MPENDPLNLETNLRIYLDGGDDTDGRQPNERYTSFDYCFNYFHSFRESGNTRELVSPAKGLPPCRRERDKDGAPLQSCPRFLTIVR